MYTAKVAVYCRRDTLHVPSIHPDTKGKGNEEMILFLFVATKPVFGVSNKARLKPISSATETS